MKWLLLIVVVLVIAAGVFAAAVGAIHVRSDQNNINVTVDKNRLKEKAEQGVQAAKEAGSAALQQTGQALKNAAKGIRGSSDAQPPADVSEKPKANSERQQEEKTQHDAR